MGISPRFDLQVILNVNKLDVGITGLTNTIQRRAMQHKTALKASLHQRADVGAA